MIEHPNAAMNLDHRYGDPEIMARNHVARSSMPFQRAPRLQRCAPRQRCEFERPRSARKAGMSSNGSEAWCATFCTLARRQEMHDTRLPG
jgi:hypothetical protein